MHTQIRIQFKHPTGAYCLKRQKCGILHKLDWVPSFNKMMYLYYNCCLYLGLAFALDEDTSICCILPSIIVYLCKVGVCLLTKLYWLWICLLVKEGEDVAVYNIHESVLWTVSRLPSFSSSRETMVLVKLPVFPSRKQDEPFLVCFVSTSSNMCKGMIHSLEKEFSRQSLNKLFSSIKFMHSPELVKYKDVKVQSEWVRGESGTDV